MRILTLILTTALGAAALPAAAAGLSPEARLDKLIDGRVAGKPVSCINLQNVRSTQIIDDTAIVYRVGSRLYVNRPRNGANWLDRDDILVTRTHSSQLCRIDTVRLIDGGSNFSSGFVSLGDFVPYTRR